MLRTLLFGLALSAALAPAAPACEACARLFAQRQAEAEKDFVGTLKALPGDRIVLEAPSRTYELDFASRTASREARKLLGLRVTLRATEKNGRLKVFSSAPEVTFCDKR